MMKTLSLSEITQGDDWVGLGIAGNQAEHLDQAGEADDFKDIDSLDNAPKGMFPWFVPGAESFLGTNPLSSTQIKLNAADPLQPEPEIALFVKFAYASSEALLEDIEVIGFSAFNDCSRRISAAKISHKKNWGPASQGMAAEIVPLSDFNDPSGHIDNYRLVCYLERDGALLHYGKNTAVSDYCYFNQTLVDWMVHQINTQQDKGPLEPIAQLIADSKPAYGVIGIGATCYTDFGNSDTRFLQPGDQVYVVAYDASKHTSNEVEAALTKPAAPISCSSMLVLQQSAVN